MTSSNNHDGAAIADRLVLGRSSADVFPLYYHKAHPMPDLADAVATAAIRNAAAELSGLIETVKATPNLEDEALDNLAWRGDALLDQIAGHRAVSLKDILLKLELWRRLPADLWDTGPIITSLFTDLQELVRQPRSCDPTERHRV